MQTTLESRNSTWPTLPAMVVYTPTIPFSWWILQSCSPKCTTSPKLSQNPKYNTHRSLNLLLKRHNIISKCNCCLMDHTQSQQLVYFRRNTANIQHVSWWLLHLIATNMQIQSMTSERREQHKFHLSSNTWSTLLFNYSRHAVTVLLWMEGLLGFGKICKHDSPLPKNTCASINQEELGEGQNDHEVVGK